MAFPVTFRSAGRQTVRVDATLAVGAITEEVTVRSGAPLINTETPTVSGKVDNRELQQLPFTFRTENTSPIPAIQAIPEVQRAGQQFSLSGALPYQTEVSVDGILTTSVRRNGIGAEGINVFPSIESVEEIKVSSVNNTAEYSQLGDITTISRPGTNQLRGTARSSESITMVIRETPGCSVWPTVSDSILKPRRRISDATLVNTPGSSST